MKFSKGMLVLVGGIALSSVASAQDAAAPATTAAAPGAAPAVAAEKASPLKTVLPDSYGKIQLRHYESVKMQDQKVVGTVPLLDIRPTLGTTLFGGKVDTSFNWIFYKRAETAYVERVTMYNATQWTLVDTKYGTFSPYAEIYNEGTGHTYDDAYVGFIAESTPKIELASGTFDFDFILEPLAQMNSKAYANSKDAKAPVRDATGRDTPLTLADLGDKTGAEGDPAIVEKDPTLWNYVDIVAKFSPASAKAFSVGLAVDTMQRWRPKYVVTDPQGNGDVRAKLDGYSPEGQVMNRFLLSYKINDKVTISEQVRQYIGGIYNRGINSDDKSFIEGTTRWQNRVYLSATLF